MIKYQNQNKYLKYKKKYLDLKGGAKPEIPNDDQLQSKSEDELKQISKDLRTDLRKLNEEKLALENYLDKVLKHLTYLTHPARNTNKTKQQKETVISIEKNVKIYQSKLMIILLMNV